jgi:hypothetical protein
MGGYTTRELGSWGKGPCCMMTYMAPGRRGRGEWGSRFWAKEQGLADRRLTAFGGRKGEKWGYREMAVGGGCWC